MPIGAARIVGKVINGALTWEPGEPTEAENLVVTKAFAAKFYSTLWLCAIQEKEIKKLQEALEKRK